MPISVLFQTGYLTIVDYSPQRRMFSLDYPNQEVREAFDLGLLAALTGYATADPRSRAIDLWTALEAGDLTRVIALVDATLADVPHQLWRQGEVTFHMIVHVFFRTVGAYVRSEVSSARGRADAIVETTARVYAFEFKVGGNVETAPEQIRERGYLERYGDDARQSVAVGVVFDAERRSVGAWRDENM